MSFRQQITSLESTNFAKLNSLCTQQHFWPTEGKLNFVPLVWHLVMCQLECALYPGRAVPLLSHREERSGLNESGQRRGMFLVE